MLYYSTLYKFTNDTDSDSDIAVNGRTNMSVPEVAVTHGTHVYDM